MVNGKAAKKLIYIVHNRNEGTMMKSSHSVILL